MNNREYFTAQKFAPELSHLRAKLCISKTLRCDVKKRSNKYNVDTLLYNLILKNVLSIITFYIFIKPFQHYVKSIKILYS